MMIHHSRIWAGGRGHSDRPDYSRKGQSIWYNSGRGGTTQIWHICTDGSHLEQMTDDDRVN